MQVLFYYISFVVCSNKKLIQTNINLGGARGVAKKFWSCPLGPLTLKLLPMPMDRGIIETPFYSSRKVSHHVILDLAPPRREIW